MRISDWSSDVCSSDLSDVVVVGGGVVGAACALALAGLDLDVTLVEAAGPAHWSPSHPDLRVFAFAPDNAAQRSEEHTSDLQSLMRTSYAVCYSQKKMKHNNQQSHNSSKYQNTSRT